MNSAKQIAEFIEGERQQSRLGNLLASYCSCHESGQGQGTHSLGPLFLPNTSTSYSLVPSQASPPPTPAAQGSERTLSSDPSTFPFSSVQGSNVAQSQKGEDSNNSHEN